MESSELQSVRRQRSKRTGDQHNQTQNSYFYQDSFINGKLQEKDYKPEKNQFAQTALKNIIEK